MYRMDDCIRIRKDCECQNPLPYMDIHGRDGGLIEFAGGSIRVLSFIFLIEEKLGAYKVWFIKKSDNLLEVRSTISVSEGREEYLKKVVEIVTEYLVSEGCTDYEVTLSLEDPVRNKRGGKLSTFLNF